MAVDKERLKAAARIQRGEGKAKGRVRLLRVRGSVELREVASSSATPGLWLGDSKVGSQVSGKDRIRPSGRGRVGEVRRGGRRGRRASDRAKKIVYEFMVRFR